MTKSERTRAWQKANPEKHRAIRRRHYLKYKVAIHAKKKLWREKNPEKVKAQAQRRRQKHPDSIKASMFKTRYGVSITVFHSLFEKQKGLCAICKKSKAIHTDHNHTTGKMRGILCSPCNLALGGFKDSPESLSSAIEYLKDHEPAEPHLI